jgi:hypothetical protein
MLESKTCGSRVTHPIYQHLRSACWEQHRDYFGTWLHHHANETLVERPVKKSCESIRSTEAKSGGRLNHIHRHRFDRL